MNYMEIKYPDVANGPGVRVSLFVAGCDRHCPGCFNPESWPHDAGALYTHHTEERLLWHLDRPEVSGLSILGGEPLSTHSLPAIRDLVRRAKRRQPDKPLWIWSGYTIEALGELRRLEGRRYQKARHQLAEILTLADVLVDGPYVETERDLTLQFRGSRNQRIIDLRRSEAAGKVVLWEGRA